MNTGKKGNRGKGERREKEEKQGEKGTTGKWRNEKKGKYMGKKRRSVRR